MLLKCKPIIIVCLFLRLGAPALGFPFFESYFSSRMAPEEVRFANSEGGRESVIVPPGATVIVILPGNKTTGYSWTLDNEEKLPGGVTEKSHEYIADKHKPGIVGSGGEFHFTLVAPEKEGTYTVKFRNARPWEGKDDSQSKAQVEISVARSSEPTGR